MRKFYSLLIAAFAAVLLLLPATSQAWVMDYLPEDSLATDTFFVVGADVDTSDEFSFSSAGLGDIYFSICVWGDTTAVRFVLEERIQADTNFATIAAGWEPVDSIVFASGSALACSLWVPTFKVPPYKCQIIARGAATNCKGPSASAPRCGTKALITYFRENENAD